MFMFFEINDSIIKTAALIIYFAVLLFAFGKGREIRMKRREKKFRQKLFDLLETDELPLFKGRDKVNWGKVKKMLKALPDSPEKAEILEEVEARINDRSKLHEEQQKG